MTTTFDGKDRFAYLRQQASDRADRTVERTRAGIAVLQAAGQRITAESLKQATRELEPGFAGVSFQTIRRNPRAYALYRDTAEAFRDPPSGGSDRRRRKPNRQRRRKTEDRTTRALYDPLEGYDKRALVKRIRLLEADHEAERVGRQTLAFDRQVLLRRILELETQVILLQAERTNSI